VGGAAGALLRWGLGEVVPDGRGFPWTTFVVNVTGALLLALLPALTTRPLLVLALGPGVLGGFTTLSAYADHTRALLASGEAAVAAAYVVGTLAACVAAVHVAHRVTTPAQRRVFEDEEGNE
jgi:CrcB protein